MESRRNGPQLSSRHDDDDDGAIWAPHNGVWGRAPAANEIPCILVEIWSFPGILEHFLR